jgi:hypothetical protein
MMFRDESQALSIKHQRQASSKKSHAPASKSPLNESVVDSVTASSPYFINNRSKAPTSEPVNYLSRELGNSAEEQATCFFFKNYILDEHKFHNGNFQYLFDMYHREEIGDALAESVISLGMVGIANFWKAPNVMVNANMKYTSALRLVNSRLRNVEEAKSDQTLVAVMLLGLYEVRCVVLVLTFPHILTQADKFLQ